MGPASTIPQYARIPRSLVLCPVSPSTIVEVLLVLGSQKRIPTTSLLDPHLTVHQPVACVKLSTRPVATSRCTSAVRGRRSNCRVVHTPSRRGTKLAVCCIDATSLKLEFNNDTSSITVSMACESSAILTLLISIAFSVSVPSSDIDLLL